MHGTRLFLVFAVLLVTTHARPDGYGVKGGRFHKSSASAVASAQATAHADAGGLGIAKSFASAIANSSGAGGMSNADAIADASVDEGNIGKVIASETSNGNANEPGDTDDLRRTSDRDTVDKCIDHKDGTTSSGHRNHDAEHVAPGAYENLDESTEQGRDDRDCGSAGLESQGSASVGFGESRCKETVPSVSDQFSTHPGELDSSADSQHSVGIDSEYEEKSPEPGMIGGSHGTSLCAPGDMKCFASKPSVSNSHSTHVENPDLSAGSTSAVGIDGGYGGNSPKHGTIGGNSGASPCTRGDSNCFAHKPTTSNSHPMHERNPHGSADSQQPIEIDSGYGEKIEKPETFGASHDASLCTPGDSKCFENKPGVSSSNPTHVENPDLSAGSSSPVGIDGGYGGNSPKHGTIGGNPGASPCTRGDSNCFAHKPTTSNSHPMHERNPHGSADSQQLVEIDSGYGEKFDKPETFGASHAASLCTPGDSKCFENKPSVSNPHPTHVENPDLSAGSSSPVGIDGGYGGNSPKHGTIAGNPGASPCTRGDSNCFAHKPTTSNSHPMHERNPHGSADSQQPIEIDSGYGEKIEKPETFGASHDASPCTPGDLKCFASKPSVSNPYPTHVKNPDLSAGSSSPVGIDGGYGGNSPKPGTIGGNPGASPCTRGDSNCFAHKPTTSNSHPMHDRNPHGSADSQQLVEIDSGYGEKFDKPETFGASHAASLCTPGDSKCFENKPSVSNPHPTHVENPDLSAGSSSPVGIDGGYGGNSPKHGTIAGNPGASPCTRGDSNCFAHKPTASNPHPIHERDPHGSADSQQLVEIDSGYGERIEKPDTFGASHTSSTCAPGNSKCSGHKPSVSNPHSTYDASPDTWGSDSKYPESWDNGYGDKPTNGDHSSSTNAAGHRGSSGNKPKTSNPFLNGDIDLSDIKNPSSSTGFPVGKPNPLNPFLYPQNQLHPLTDPIPPNNPIGNNGASVGVAPQYPQGGSSVSSNLPVDKPKPSNPFLTHHGQASDSASSVKHSTSGSQQNNNSPSTAGHRVPNASPNESPKRMPIQPDYPHGHTTGSGNRENKPNPSNPFVSQHHHGDESTDGKYPKLGNQDKQQPGDHQAPTGAPSSDCHGSCSPSKPTGDSLVPFVMDHERKVKGNGASLSGHGSIQYPGNQPDDSNPFFGSDQFMKQQPKPESHGPFNLKPVTGPWVTNPHSGPDDDASLGEERPDVGDSMAEGHGIASNKDYGVKGRRPVGSNHRGDPVRLESGVSDDFGSGKRRSSAESTANASAYSHAHASSSSAGGQSIASAKSEAYSSDDGGYGTSNSWSSSSASASAFASSDSSSYSHHGWTGPKIPEVPAQ